MEVPSAQGKPSGALRDSLPLFLDKLIESLDTLVPRLTTARDVALCHSVQRAEFTDFDLEQIMSEYNNLGQLIFRILNENRVEVSAQERNIVLDFIQHGKMAAASRCSQIVVDRTQRSEKRFRALFELSATGIALIDPVSDRLILVNPKLAELLGYDAEELRGRTLSSLTCPTDVARQLQACKEAIANNVPEWRIQIRYIRKDGSLLWAELWSTLVKDAAGQPELVMTNVLDITERERAEQERQRLLGNECVARSRAELAVQRFHDLLEITESARSPTTSLDQVLNSALAYIHRNLRADTVTILMANDSGDYLEVRAAYGLAEDLARKIRIPKGVGVEGRVLASERPLVIDDLQRDPELSSPTLAARKIRCLMGTPLRTKKQVIGVILVGRQASSLFHQDDIQFLQIIADRLAVAIDNAALYTGLQNKVVELKAERELRERFVATLAHDLRNPLTAARMGVDLALRYPDRPEARERQLGKSIHNLIRADRMIENLLDANRIRAGEKLPLEVASCNLRDVAQDVLDEMSMTSTHQLELDSPQEVNGYWSCNGLRRILENLLTNAAKYGSADTPITTRIQVGADRVQLSVHNLGPPIPESEMQKLFEPFHRAPDAERMGKPGWGLGLTLVRGLAEAHGGRISLRSSELEGTTFIVDLPLDARPFQVPRP